MAPTERSDPSRFALRATLGALAYAVGGGAAALTDAVGAQRVGLTGNAAKAIPAVTLFVITVPLIALLRRRLDRRSLASLGMRGPAAAWTGFAVVAGAALAVFGVDAATGGIRVVAVDGPRLAVFLLANSLLALALEAIPEELTFRGYVLSALHDRWRAWLAVFGTTALFIVTPTVAIGIGAGLGRLTGLRTPPWTFAPGGQDPAGYAVLLAVFGTMLAVARLTTGSLWTCVAAHLTFLTVNRLLVTRAFDTGVTIEAPAGEEVLVLVYLLLAIALFGLLARLRHGAGHTAGTYRLRRRTS